VDDIPASGCKEFALQGAGEPDCFLVYRGGTLRAYRNRCPHTGAPLNWQPDVFLDFQGRHIQCDLHGAQFRIEDGACLYGPCNGEGLQPVAVTIAEGAVWLCEEDVPLIQ
jgi:nitrite reductase/ring-hydroxylating ferredoxin subunit